jgi:hypothetical protein
MRGQNHDRLIDRLKQPGRSTFVHASITTSVSLIHRPNIDLSSDFSDAAATRSVALNPSLHDRQEQHAIVYKCNSNR